MKALAEGLYIKHFQYGCGVITDSNSDKTRIDFDLHGTKLFVTGLMVVEPAEGTPPKRSRRKKKVPGAPLTAKAVAKAAAKSALKAAAKTADKSAVKTEDKPEAKAAAGAK
ncbi:MAG: hypothetical protein WAM91_01580 [Candidatus Acidiferrales bacterium]